MWLILAGLLWQFSLGKASYDSICARCHGADGNAATYAGIKPLGGLGHARVRQRLPVVTLGPDHFVIRSYHLNKRELDALIFYVGSLK
jgi:hypothetical protein